MCACVRCVNAALSTSAGDRDRIKNLSAHKIVVQPNQAFSLQVHPQLLNRSANTATEFCRIFWIVALTQRFCGVGCFCMMRLYLFGEMVLPGFYCILKKAWILIVVHKFWYSKAVFQVFRNSQPSTSDLPFVRLAFDSRTNTPNTKTTYRPKHLY